MAEQEIIDRAEGTRMRGLRYFAIEGSNSAHCCFEGSVLDAAEPYFYGGSETKVLGYKCVCETFDFTDAERIAVLLNAVQ